jgi:hypothetical protein
MPCSAWLTSSRYCNCMRQHLTSCAVCISTHDWTWLFVCSLLLSAQHHVTRHAPHSVASCHKPHCPASLAVQLQGPTLQHSTMVSADNVEDIPKNIDLFSLYAASLAVKKPGVMTDQSGLTAVRGQLWQEGCEAVALN